MTFSFLPLELSILEIRIDPLQKVSDSVVPSSMWSQRQRLHRYKRQKHVHIFAFVHVHYTTVCTCVYLYSTVSSCIEKRRGPFAVSQCLSKLESTWMMGRRLVNFPIQIILNVCVCVCVRLSIHYVFKTSLVTLFIYLSLRPPSVDHT